MLAKMCDIDKNTSGTIFEVWKLVAYLLVKFGVWN